MKVKKRCVTKYIPPNAAQTPLIITSCHLHKNKDGFQQRITEKKNRNVIIIKLFFSHNAVVLLEQRNRVWKKKNDSLLQIVGSNPITTSKTLSFQQ